MPQEGSHQQCITVKALSTRLVNQLLSTCHCGGHMCPDVHYMCPDVHYMCPDVHYICVGCRHVMKVRQGP
jgi:hypothetical protein